MCIRHTHATRVRSSARYGAQDSRDSKSDAISPDLPPCGGSGNKASHAHVLMSDDDDE